ncbi:hypothetical protein O3P69_000385 [Scylla paramamosain]|uniref:C3H1-type domain-containing protein n=1 Tax=Scylla paramamosain TaxID=85552 RepID=A0AAW0UST5_SCYPA
MSRIAIPAHPEILSCHDGLGPQVWEKDPTKTPAAFNHHDKRGFRGLEKLVHLPMGFRGTQYTELCRTYHAAGNCQYGARCHFVHDPEEATGVDALRGYNLRSQLGVLQLLSPQPSPSPSPPDGEDPANLSYTPGCSAVAEKSVQEASSSNYRGTIITGKLL